MRFIADENIHAGIVAWLRDQAHDVAYVAESSSGVTDRSVLDLAVQQGRILLTDDKDFGELVFLQHYPALGIVLIRLSSPRLADRISRLSSLWSEVEANAMGNLVVISDDKLRVRPLRATPPK